MKHLVPLAVLANALVIGTTFRIDPIEMTPQPQQQAPSPAPSGGRDSVLCYACEGRGTLEQTQKRGPSLSYTCPVCRGSGKRAIMDKPIHAALCDRCLGMGRIDDYTPPQSARRAIPPDYVRVKAHVCARCTGKGWLIPRHEVF